jgi:hypothetical protein
MSLTVVVRRAPRVSHAYLICLGILAVLMGALNVRLAVPPDGASAGEDSGQTFAGGAFQFQLMKLRDGRGRIPANPYGRAKSHVDLMKWSAAATRVEQAPAPAIAPAMFAAAAPASTLGPPLISPQSWRWLDLCRQCRRRHLEDDQRRRELGAGRRLHGRPLGLVAPDQPGERQRDVCRHR